MNRFVMLSEAKNLVFGTVDKRLLRFTRNDDFQRKAAP